MNNKKTGFLPSEIFKAIEEAKQRNPKDKNGYGAIRINMENTKEYSSTVYIPLEIYQNNEWRRLNVRIIGITHKGRIQALNEGEWARNKTNYLKITTRFLASDYFQFKNKTEEYGKLKLWLNSAVSAHVEKHQRKGDIDPDKKFIPNVRLEKKTKKGTKTIKTPIEDPDINIQIKFKRKTPQEKHKDPNTEFDIDILDAENLQSGPDGKKKFMPLKVEDEYGNKYPINNGNIHKAIPGGSILSGVENLGSVCVHNFGISCLSSWDMLMVKRPVNRGVTQDDFDEDEINAIAGGVAKPMETSENPVDSDEDMVDAFQDINIENNENDENDENNENEEDLDF